MLFNLPKLTSQTTSETNLIHGWYAGTYTLNPNSGSSPMPDAGKTGELFIYFYENANKQTCSILYQKSILPFQHNLLEKHGPYDTDTTTITPVGWGQVGGNYHCEFFLPASTIVPGKLITSEAGLYSDIYYLKDNSTLYYYHTSLSAVYIGNDAPASLSPVELKRILEYVKSSRTMVKLY
ncbi:hypothetical protein [Mucilaginibacter agri]|uniref:Uncharacterized protein n=1 Tax=Mucilaginibacter agri TaxID=2695265 RepID=A0A965ZF92_9SPHI|nr:hypothetical protein [Mucilaginibacter agri]NCD69635.1 hypothetical protein [Mucilaginibacter agri]